MNAGHARAATPPLLAAGLWALLSLALLPGATWGADAPAYDTEFAIPEVEESPFEFWGQAEWRFFGRMLDKESAAYRQRFYKDPQEDLSGDALLSVKPEFSMQYSQAGAYLRPRLDLGCPSVFSRRTGIGAEPYCLRKASPHGARGLPSPWRPARRC